MYDISLNSCWLFSPGFHPLNSSHLDYQRVLAKLFGAAHRYKMVALSKVCEDQLKYAINVENVAEIWHQAVVHDAKDLLRYTAKYMNIKEKLKYMKSGIFGWNAGKM